MRENLVTYLYALLVFLIIVGAILDLALHLTELKRLRTGEADSIAVLSVAWPTTTVPWIAETGVAACVSLLTSERDDWRRRYEALTDDRAALIDQRNAALNRYEALRDGVLAWAEKERLNGSWWVDTAISEVIARVEES